MTMRFLSGKADLRTRLLSFFIASLGLLLAGCRSAAEPAASTATAGAEQLATIPSPSFGENEASPIDDSQTPEVARIPVATPVAFSEPAAGISNQPAREVTANSAAYPTRKLASAYADLEIVTLLPPDAIPAVDNPQFLTAQEADEFYNPDELVMGVSFDGDSRAYSAPFLSNHEIVNDTVGGRKIAITW